MFILLDTKRNCIVRKWFRGVDIKREEICRKIGLNTDNKQIDRVIKAVVSKCGKTSSFFGEKGGET